MGFLGRQPVIIHCEFRIASTDHNAVGDRPVPIMYRCVVLPFLDPLLAEQRAEEVRLGFLSLEVVDGARSRGVHRECLLQKVKEGTVTPAPSQREADMAGFVQSEEEVSHDSGHSS